MLYLLRAISALSNGLAGIYQDTLDNHLRIHPKLLVGEADALDLPSTQGSPVIL